MTSLHNRRRTQTISLIGLLSLIFTLTLFPNQFAQAADNKNVEVRLVRLDLTGDLYVGTTRPLTLEWDTRKSSPRPSPGDSFVVGLPKTASGEVFGFVGNGSTPMIFDGREVGLCVYGGDTQPNPVPGKPGLISDRQSVRCAFNERVSTEQFYGTLQFPLKAIAPTDETDLTMNLNGSVENLMFDGIKTYQRTPGPVTYTVRDKSDKWNRIRPEGTTKKIAWAFSLSKKSLGFSPSEKVTSFTVEDQLAEGHAFYTGEQPTPQDYGIFSFEELGSPGNPGHRSFARGSIDGDPGNQEFGVKVEYLDNRNARITIIAKDGFELMGDRNYQINYVTFPNNSSDGRVLKGFNYGNVIRQSNGEIFKESATYVSSLVVTVDKEGYGAFKLTKMLEGLADSKTTRFKVSVAWTLPNGKTAADFVGWDDKPATNPLVLELEAGEPVAKHFPEGTEISLTEIYDGTSDLVANFRVGSRDHGTAARFVIGDRRINDVVLTNTVREIKTGPGNNSFEPKPGFTMVKHAELIDTNSNKFADLGETINYTFTVHNTGNVIVSDIEVVDPKAGAVTCPRTFLPGGEGMVCSAKPYVVTQEDIDAGGVRNTATVKGKTFYDEKPTYPNNGNTTFTPAKPDPKFTFAKTGSLVDKNGNAKAANATATAGDKINYTFTVTNTGNVTLNNIVITDKMLGDSWKCDQIKTLARGASDSTTCSGSYTVTQADIDKGEKIVNTANAIADNPGGGDPIKPSNPNDNTVTTDVTKGDPKFTFVKTGTLTIDNGQTGKADAGDVITYKFTVTNTGNVTLNNIVITDEMLGDSWKCTITELKVGATDETCNGTYTVTQADLDDNAGGTITNTATATGKGPGGKTDATPDNQSDPRVDTPAAQADPKLSVKVVPTVVDVNKDKKPGNPGDSIEFKLVVTNDGNVTVTVPQKVTVNGPDGKPLEFTCATSVAPGKNVECAAKEYPIQKSDFDKGTAQLDNPALEGTYNTTKVPATVTSNPVVQLDKDSDGLMTNVDACPTLPGPANKDPKKNGCPDWPDGTTGVGTPIKVTPGIGTGTGWPTGDDGKVELKVDGPGKATIDPKTGIITVTPNKASDGDKITVTVTKDGKPVDTFVVTVTDKDSDGVKDSDDACPTLPGPVNKDPKKNGCPDWPDGTTGVGTPIDLTPNIGEDTQWPKDPGVTVTTDGPGTATIDPETGIVTLVPDGAKDGDKITVTVKDKDGKVIDVITVTIKDKDSDGVTDGDDKCPGTPEGAKVDENGCSVAPTAELKDVIGEVGKAIDPVIIKIDNPGKQTIVNVEIPGLPKGLEARYDTDKQEIVISGTPEETFNADLTVKITSTNELGETVTVDQSGLKVKIRPRGKGLPVTGSSEGAAGILGLTLLVIAGAATLVRRRG